MKSKEVISITELPERLNMGELRKALLEEGAVFVGYSDVINWTKKDEQGQEYIETEPARLEVGLSDGVSHDAIRSLVASHNPEKTDTEQAQERKEAQLIELLQAASPTLKQALREAIK